jgi:hypothetical protein
MMTMVYLLTSKWHKVDNDVTVTLAILDVMIIAGGLGILSGIL